MCRLFGLSGGAEPIRATFWLLEAPDSLAAQSRREPDGTGLGTFDADGIEVGHRIGHLLHQVGGLPDACPTHELAAVVFKSVGCRQPFP